MNIHDDPASKRDLLFLRKLCIIFYMKVNPYPGKFISIDGIDGSGKSTQAEFIYDWFKNRGHEVFIGHEPTVGKIGLKIQEIISNRVNAPDDHMELQKMFIQDRKDHIERTIIRVLKGKNSVYVSDRYFLSTFAYGMAEGLKFDDLMAAHEDILGNSFIIPDMMLVVESPVDIAMARLRLKKGEKNLEYFERREDVMRKVAEQFKLLKGKFENMRYISGDLAIPDVTDEIQKTLVKNF